MAEKINQQKRSEVSTARIPKTKRGKRAIALRSPRVVEGSKNVLVFKGNKTTPTVLGVLADLKAILQPEVVNRNYRRNNFHPFDNANEAEYLCRKNHCGLFLFGSNAKKRPNRITLGRTFDHQLLDMVEFEISELRTMQNDPEFATREKSMLYCKPLVLFQGPGFETTEVLKTTKNILADLFDRGRPKEVLLKGLDHVVVLSAYDDKDGTNASEATNDKRYRIAFHHFKIKLKRSTTSKLPYAELEEIGPAFTMRTDRYLGASKELWRAATKVPKEIKPKKTKNVSTNVLGEKRGRVHVDSQDFSTLHTPHAHSKKKQRVKIPTTTSSADDG